jgi:Major Facilitator Superfamily
MPPVPLAYRSAQGRWVVAAMIAGSSVAGIDSTVVAVALPAIGRSLHAGFADLQWTVTGYTLTLAALILLAGSLSDRWGRRRVFLAGLGWFTTASVLCAAAPGGRRGQRRLARRAVRRHRAGRDHLRHHRPARCGRRLLDGGAASGRAVRPGPGGAHPAADR